MATFKIGEMDGNPQHAGAVEGIGLVQFTSLNKFLIKDLFTRKPLPPEVRDFNPDTHVIVTKEQLEITNQIKQLTGLVSQVEQVASMVSDGNAVQAEIATKVNEFHTVHTGKNFKLKAEKPKLTKKEREQIEINEMRSSFFKSVLG